MKTRGALWTAAGVCGVLACLAGADTIETIHGTKVEGVIIRESPDSVMIETTAGRMTLQRKLIKSIQLEGEANQHLRAGDQHRKRGEYGQAREYYHAAAAFPEAAEAAARRLAELDLLVSAETSAAEARIREQVDQLVAAGKLEQAVTLLANFVANNEVQPELRRHLGALRADLAFWYYDHVRDASALEQIELAKRDNAPPERLHLLWAKIDMLEQRWSFARQEYEMALAANPAVAEEVAKVVRESASLREVVTALSRPELPEIRRPLPPKPLTQTREQQLAVIAEAVFECSAEFGVDPLLVEAVIAAESNYDPFALSPAGAQGLMQLMPATAKMLGVTDSYDIAQNVRGGVQYLLELQNTFGPDELELVLAAYNAGPSRVKRYDNKVPPYRETRDYVRRVSEYYQKLKKNEIASRLPVG